MTVLPELVSALLKPEAYPDTPETIQLVQTQMSFVFLTGHYVYKIKKPVNLGYLDYTTLEKRSALCFKEVELNRRLCPSVYLGVVPITKTLGKISLNGPGEIIEYAVKMHSLPQDRMMNLLLQQDKVDAGMLGALAAKLAEFHAAADSGADIAEFGNIKAIKTNCDENFSQTEKYIGETISNEKYNSLKDFTGSFLTNNVSLFRGRVKGRCIRDCHGDLHAAHVCFTRDICIYDCIEFNDRFRYCDTASEIAFLAMDMDHYGRADLSRLFVQAYIDKSGDKDLRKLLNFYKCYRAYVRGKVEGFKLGDPYINEEEKKKSKNTAAGYFDLAESYTWSKPKLIIMVGLVGTGKSTVAGELARRLGLVSISSDITRKKLAGISSGEHCLEDFSGGIYSPEFTKKTYDALYSGAEGVLSQGGSVVLDAAFLKREERLKAAAIAARSGADFTVVECSLAETVVKKRLAERLKLGSVSDGRWEIYLPQKKNFEPVNEVPENAHITINTAKPVESYISDLIGKITRS